MSDNIPTNAEGDPVPAVKIPVNNLVSDEVPQTDAEVDELVREYEEKYSGLRSPDAILREARQREEQKQDQQQETDYHEKSKNDWQSIKSNLFNFKPDFRPTWTTATTTEEERMWAAIAHASTLLTLLIGLPTGGLATLFTMFIPLGIYFAYRQKSEFVANQALQSFALQVICTLGAVFAAIAVVLVGALVTVVLAITIVGVLAIPFLWLGIVLVLAVLLLLPIAMGVLGAVGAWESYQGMLFNYPYIAKWIETQMHGGFLTNM